jgi:hypothetical protein
MEAWLTEVCKPFGWQFTQAEDGQWVVYCTAADGNQYELWRGTITNITNGWEIRAKAMAAQWLLLVYGADIEIAITPDWLAALKAETLLVPIPNAEPSQPNPAVVNDPLTAMRMTDKGGNYLGAVREQHANTANPPIGVSPEEGLVFFPNQSPQKMRELNW